MKSALYFPNLRGKPDEIKALGHLSPLVRPMIDLPKPKSDSTTSIDQFLLDKSTGVASSWGTAPGDR
jgi:hypothetical protein